MCNADSRSHSQRCLATSTCSRCTCHKAAGRRGAESTMELADSCQWSVKPTVCFRRNCGAFIHRHFLYTNTAEAQPSVSLYEGIAVFASVGLVSQALLLEALAAGMSCLFHVFVYEGG